jgi:hypothetical protein
VTGGNRGHVTRIVWWAVAAPHHLQIGPDEDEIVPVELAQGARVERHLGTGLCSLGENAGLWATNRADTLRVA